MKTVIFAMLFTVPTGWPSASSHIEAEPWVEPIGTWYKSFKRWKSCKA